MITSLTHVELQIIRYIVDRRKEYNRKHGRNRPLHTGIEHNKLAHLRGYAGEWAYCKMMNLYPDMGTEECQQYDAIVGGYRVDVKTTMHKQGRLLIPTTYEIKEPPDYYALIIGLGPAGEIPRNYKLAGYAAFDTLINTRRIDTSLPVPAWTMAQDDLIEDIP